LSWHLILPSFHPIRAVYQQTLQEEACRAPIVLVYMQNLRKQIMKQRDGEWLQPGTFRHPCNEETRLLDLVGDFLKAFLGLKKHMNTPFPFPLVQMTKTFLFVWMFSLPFALCHDKYNEITNGFCGLDLSPAKLPTPLVTILPTLTTWDMLKCVLKTPMWPFTNSMVNVGLVGCDAKSWDAWREGRHSTNSPNPIDMIGTWTKKMMQKKMLLRKPRRNLFRRLRV